MNSHVVSSIMAWIGKYIYQNSDEDNGKHKHAIFSKVFVISQFTINLKIDDCKNANSFSHINAGQIGPNTIS